MATTPGLIRPGMLYASSMDIAVRLDALHVSAYRSRKFLHNVMVSVISTIRRL